MIAPSPCTAPGWLAGRPIGKEQSAELRLRHQAVLEALPALRSKNLACWCPLPEHGEPDNCHAALLKLANPQRATTRPSKARNT